MPTTLWAWLIRDSPGRLYGGRVTRELVFIPIARDELAAIEGTPQLTDRPAHRVTPELLAALGYTIGQEEEAEYAALTLASVSALARFGERLVLVAEIPGSSVVAGDDPDNGACIVTRVDRESMTCWFSEAPGVDASAAAIAVRGLDIDTAWGFDEVQDLLRESDLLWNDVEEYRRGLC